MKVAPPARSTTKIKRGEPGYVTIPRELLLHPPIRHRHHNEKVRVTPFEFGVACGLLRLARKVVTADRHERAFAAGGKQIVEEMKLSKKFKEDWRATRKARRKGDDDVPAPKRRHAFYARVIYSNWNERRERFGLPPDRGAYRPIKTSDALRTAGQQGYRDKRSRLRERVPDMVEVTVTRSALLRAAHLPPTGGNLRRLTPALQRLTRPVGGLPPLISSWSSQGTLQVQVEGIWLAPPFGRIPLPFPRGPSALSLYLFMFAIELGPGGREGMEFRRLCERLGIPTQWGSAGRSLTRALNAVNAHLKAFPELGKHRIEVPPYLLAKETRDGWVRLYSQRQTQDREVEVEVDERNHEQYLKDNEAYREECLRRLGIPPKSKF